MHLLMRAIVLRAAGPAHHHLQTEAQPPDGETRPAARTVAAERCAVVHLQRPGQAVTAEQGREHAPHRRIRGRGQMPHREHTARHRIAHGEGLNPPAVGGAKLAFEVRRPQIVGSPDRESCARRPPAVPATNAAGFAASIPPAPASGPACGARAPACVDRPASATSATCPAPTSAADGAAPPVAPASVVADRAHSGAAASFRPAPCCLPPESAATTCGRTPG